MTTTINGRTPEEIKKGLKFLGTTNVTEKVELAAQGLAYAYYEDFAADTLAYIRQLENHIGELTEKVAQIKAEQQNLLCDFSVACLNIEKLKRRYPEEFDAEHSLHREDE